MASTRLNERAKRQGAVFPEKGMHAEHLRAFFISSPLSLPATPSQTPMAHRHVNLAEAYAVLGLEQVRVSGRFSRR